jgi:hypothetical protein
MPASMSTELWGVIKGRSGFNVYEGQTLAVASKASAVLYRPVEGGFAATAPLIRGYNIPASVSTELWAVIKGREGFNVYEGQTVAVASKANAVLYRPVEGGFAATAPLIAGHSMPASKVQHRAVEGSFAATAPLIPGYTVPHNISLELWGVITGRDGFNVYEGR